MIVPAGHRVVVQPDKVTSEHEVEGTDIRIALVQDEKMERANQVYGTLIAVGPDAWKAFRQVNERGSYVNGKPWATVGDRVVYSRFAGKSITDSTNGEEIILLNDEDIGARVVEGSNFPEETK